MARCTGITAAIGNAVSSNFCFSRRSPLDSADLVHCHRNTGGSEGSASIVRHLVWIDNLHGEAGQLENALRVAVMIKPLLIPDGVKLRTEHDEAGDHAIAEGDAFLRVSFFEHEAVPAEKLRKAPPLEAYLRDVQKIAATMFPSTFLDTKDISEKASRSVLNRLRKEALAWVVLVAVVFTGLQIVAAWFTGSGRPTMSEIESLKDKVEAMQSKLLKSEFTSEWDKYSQITYRENFGNEHPIAGDIREYG
ncbi:hypothetical protein GPL17_28510 [Bradyrhizobium yuanmingense]|uniref:hypothetical protein n=1 Tax=Bradyrhizobium yuanmingense TaxID=108015 RepID=UPI0012F8DCD2|nr:hypothetical protein [Bradyrhizobium yuanmingense]MVT54398.1 hypothetical protein [Bradyrhizobium yuanmingense]